MANDVRIVFHGDALIKLFESERGELASYILAVIVRIERNAKRLCPVDSGRLRASITHEIGEDFEGLYGMVGTNVHYAKYVEYGTRYMAAQPFLRPAIKATQNVSFG